MIAEKYDFSKDTLDRYAFATTQKAITAINAGHFDNEILPLQERIKDMPPSDQLHAIDEGVRFNASLEAINGLKVLAGWWAFDCWHCESDSVMAPAESWW